VSVRARAVEAAIEEAQAGLAGRRGRRRVPSRSGRYARAAVPGEQEHGYDVAVDATLRAAALRRAAAGEEGAFTITAGDLRKKIRERPAGALVLFVVDASDSVGSTPRMAVAKGAVLDLLTGAYQKRHRVGLVAFRGAEAEVLLPPSASVALANECLHDLPTGGETPFADGLFRAWQLVRTARIKEPDVEPLLVILSDGEANVPREPGADVSAELHALARRIRDDHIRCVAIDTEAAILRSNKMSRLAESLGATYHHIDELHVRELVETVRAAESE